ncbi:MAG TPA: hypothetical protein VIK31_03195 [Propionibacteriaceae bacterium]
MAGFDLDAVKARLAHVTPGRWEASRTADTEETSLEWLKACLIVPDSPAKNILHVIWATDQPGVIIPAVTGDGPTSSQNAEFIAHAPEDIAAMVAAIERAIFELNRIPEYAYTGHTPTCQGEPGCPLCRALAVLRGLAD